MGSPETKGKATSHIERGETMVSLGTLGGPQCRNNS